MGGISMTCPGADPASAYRIESRPFVSWFKAALDRRDRFSSPPPHLWCRHHVPQTLNSSWQH